MRPVPDELEKREAMLRAGGWVGGGESWSPSQHFTYNDPATGQLVSVSKNVVRNTAEALEMEKHREGEDFTK